MNVKQTSPLVGILIGCGAVFGIGCLVLCGGVVWLVSGPESGVKLSNNMDEYATKYLEENNILNGSESLLAYYDVTLSMDGSEAAILTDERVIYHKNGNTTAIELKDVADIRDRDEGMIGHVIEIDSRVGAPMKRLRLLRSTMDQPSCLLYEVLGRRPSSLRGEGEFLRVAPNYRSSSCVRRRVDSEQ